MAPEYLPPRLRTAKGFTLIERDLLAEVHARSNEGGCPDDAEVLAEALCRIKPQHVAAAIAKLRQARLLEVVLDAHDRRQLRVTELGMAYWQPPDRPLYRADLPEPPPPGEPESSEEGIRLDCSVGGRGPFDCGQPGEKKPDPSAIPDADAFAFDFDDDGPTACSTPRTREEWTREVHEGSRFHRRAKDGPPALRRPRTPRGMGIVAALQGGYDVPEDLWERLPAQVVLALHRGEPVIPMGPDKRPLVKWKCYQERLPHPAELRQWMNAFGDRIAGWARVTGRISNIIVLDDDGGGYFEKWGLRPHVLTGGGGFHWIGEYPGWKVATINAKASRALGEAFPQLDIRGDGGYSIICGYTEKGGYEWLRDGRADPLDLLPAHVRKFFGLDAPPRQKPVLEPGPPPKPGERVPSDVIVTKAVRMATSYGRNNGGFWLACQLRNNGYTETECLSIGASYILAAGSTDTRGDQKPYTIQEWEHTVRSAYSRPAQQPWNWNGA